jgi:hypothetical protein
LADVDAPEGQRFTDLMMEATQRIIDVDDLREDVTSGFCLSLFC